VRIVSYALAVFYITLPERCTKYKGAVSHVETREARLILKLYDLRRERTMREARDWYFREFNPQSFADFQAALFSEHDGYLRMVITYWDMAAALVNNGAINLDLFCDSNTEHVGVFREDRAASR
jgi:hypothetical protein